MVNKVLVIAIAIGATILIIWTAIFTQSKFEFESVQVVINNQPIDAMLAKTQDQQKIGLAGRKKLLDTEGMLFVYAQPTPVVFWMKGMLISIDLLWIKNNRIIGFESKIIPDDGQKLYRAPAAIDYVLELAGGWIERHKIIIGDQVTINKSIE